MARTFATACSFPPAARPGTVPPPCVVARADSWTTDGHKWLNLPFDNGFVFAADPATGKVVYKPVDVEKHRAFSANIKGIAPEER
jgi:hypothetical protein